MSEIKLLVADQSLQYVVNPSIYSGDVNYDSVSFDFSENWNDFVKTAVFYKSTDNIYYQLLDSNNSCTIPREVLNEKGSIFLGVFGVDNNERVITSEVIKYRVRQGVPTENLEQPDPRPDIWQQILSDYNKVKTDLEADYTTFKTDLQEEYNEFNSQAESKYNAFVEDVNERIKKDTSWEEVQNKPDTFPPSLHTHDERYYTEAEIDSKLNLKSNTNHNHDGVYLFNSRIAVVTGLLTFTNGSATTTIAYPENFRGKCACIGAELQTVNGEWYITNGTYNGHTNPKVDLLESILVTAYQNVSDGYQLSVRITLFKHS